MKCEKCGKNTASFHSVTNINGQVTEQHLCAACAAELTGREDFFSGADRMFDRMLQDFWGDGFGRLSLPGFGSFFGAPTLVRPRLRRTPAQPETQPAQAGTQQEVNAAADPEMARQRQINMLREQIRSAVENEEYEKAAQLRDQIRAMEQ